MSSESTAGRQSRTGTDASLTQKPRDRAANRCMCGSEVEGLDADRGLAVCSDCAARSTPDLHVEESHALGIGSSYLVSDGRHRTATVVLFPDGTVWGVAGDRRRYGDRFVEAAREAVVETVPGAQEAPDA